MKSGHPIWTQDQPPLDPRHFTAPISTAPRRTAEVDEAELQPEKGLAK
jgi:hypothetical protein